MPFTDLGPAIMPASGGHWATFTTYIGVNVDQYQARPVRIMHAYGGHPREMEIAESCFLVASFPLFASVGPLSDPSLALVGIERPRLVYFRIS